MPSEACNGEHSLTHSLFSQDLGCLSSFILAGALLPTLLLGVRRAERDPCAYTCRENEQVRSVPLSIRPGHVMRMQQPSASGSQTIAAPLPPHLRAQWRSPAAEGAEGVDSAERQAADVQGEHSQQEAVAAWQPEGIGGTDIAAARVPLSQNGKVLMHDLEARDRGSMAGAAQDAALDKRESIGQGQAVEGPNWSGRQLTYKGIVFDLETTGMVHLSSCMHDVD